MKLSPKEGVKRQSHGGQAQVGTLAGEETISLPAMCLSVSSLETSFFFGGAAFRGSVRIKNITREVTL